MKSFIYLLLEFARPCSHKTNAKLLISKLPLLAFNEFSFDAITPPTIADGSSNVTREKAQEPTNEILQSLDEPGAGMQLCYVFLLLFRCCC